MKRIILTIALAVAATLSANAQFRIEAGMNFGSYKIGISRISARIAPRVSVFYDLLEGENFGTEFGLQFVMQNVENRVTGNSAYGSKMSISDIQLPICEYVDFHINENFTIRPCIGAYIGVSVAGKTTRADGTTDSPFGNDGMKRFDFGIDDELLFVLGKRFSVGIGSQHGLLDRSEDSRIHIKNNAFYATVGFLF